MPIVPGNAVAILGQLHRLHQSACRRLGNILFRDTSQAARVGNLNGFVDASGIVVRHACQDQGDPFVQAHLHRHGCQRSDEQTNPQVDIGAAVRARRADSLQHRGADSQFSRSRQVWRGDLRRVNKVVVRQVIEGRAWMNVSGLRGTGLPSAGGFDRLLQLVNLFAGHDSRNCWGRSSFKLVSITVST